MKMSEFQETESNEEVSRYVNFFSFHLISARSSGRSLDGKELVKSPKSEN